MLTVMPVKEETISSPLLEQAYQSGGYDNRGEEAAVLMAKDGQEELGYVVVDRLQDRLRLLGFALTGSPNYNDLDTADQEIADLLIRSAASYALNRSVFYIETRCRPLFLMLRQMGFQQYHEKMGIDVSQLIHKCKNC